jgi:hypothetical protein
VNNNITVVDRIFLRLCRQASGSGAKPQQSPPGRVEIIQAKLGEEP